jgi:O-antigen/teichoic acid export membrane protein
MTLSLLKNFFSLAGAEAFTKLATFFAFAYLARLLGAANFGYVEWSAAVLMCASLIVDQGFTSYGAREIAKNPKATGMLTIEVVTARLLMAAIGYGVIAAFAFLAVKDTTIRSLLLIYGLSLFGLPFILQWVFQGHDRMNLVALTQIIRQTIFVGVVFVFVRTTNDLLFVGLAEVAAVFSAALFSVWLFSRNFDFKESLRPKLSGKLFREGLPIGLSQMFWTVKMFGATLMLGMVATAADTGYFAGAMRIFIALHSFVWLYYFNFLPSLSRAWEQGDGSFAETIRKSMRLVLPLSLSIGVVWILLAPFVMTSVYGNDFTNGEGALRFLGATCVTAAVSGHFRFGLIAAGFQNKEMMTSAIGAVLAAILIPVGYFQTGTSGAAAALFFAEMVVLFTSWLFAKRFLFSGNRNNEQVQNDRFENLAEATQ